MPGNPKGRAALEIDEMLEMVKKASGAAELYHVTTFRGYRPDEKGNQREITIEVLDMGPGHLAGRYTIVAEDKQGRTATGNGDDSLDVALHIVHWDELDRDEKLLPIPHITKAPAAHRPPKPPGGKRSTVVKKK